MILFEDHFFGLVQIESKTLKFEMEKRHVFALA